MYSAVDKDHQPLQAFAVFHQAYLLHYQYCRYCSDYQVQPVMSLLFGQVNISENYLY